MPFGGLVDNEIYQNVKGEHNFCVFQESSGVTQDPADLLLRFSCSVMSNSLWPHGLQHARPPSPPALNLSQHWGLFQWVGCLHQVAKVLELQLQHQSFQWIVRVEYHLIISSIDSRVSKPTICVRVIRLFTHPLSQFLHPSQWPLCEFPCAP